MATKKVNDAAKSVAPEKKAEPAKAEAVKKVEAVKAEAVKKVETVKAEVKKAAPAKKEAPAKKAAPAKKEAPAKKAEAKKPAAKKESKSVVVLQFAGKEINTEDILAAAKKAYAADNKAAIKDITLYVKPEDNAAYYVVNGDVTGKIDL